MIMDLSEIAKRPTPLLIGVQEGVRLTGLGRSRLYELMADGEIPFVHVGKRRLIPYNGLLAWANSLQGEKSHA